jgi:hypothetical protein
MFVLRLVVMERYTKEQRLVMVKTHYKYGECYVETVYGVNVNKISFKHAV